MASIQKIRGIALAAAVLGVAVTLASTASAAEIVAAPKQVGVVDGDTIQIDGRVLNLVRIDAPEIGQLCKSGGHLWACGMDSGRALQKLLAMQLDQVVCHVSDKNGGAMETASCSVGGRDLSEAMVANGMATDAGDDPGALKTVQAQAKSAGLGIWAGEFVPPARWRQGERLVAERMAETTTSQWDGFPYKVFGVRVLPVPRVHHAGCVVKARTTDDGRHEFATPLDPSYEVIPGEPSFCSDDEAERDGWLHIGQSEHPSTKSLARR